MKHTFVQDCRSSLAVPEPLTFFPLLPGFSCRPGSHKPYSPASSPLCRSFSCSAVKSKQISPSSPAIYRRGVCAIETFPIQFAYLFDACRHPPSGAATISAEAAFFASAFPAQAAGSLRPPRLVLQTFDFPKIRNSTVILSSAFLIFNVLVASCPIGTLHTGRMLFLFPSLEICALAPSHVSLCTFYREQPPSWNMQN